jgi:hypothetical protein
MEPIWMNAYHCVFDRSFEQYVNQLPAPEEVEDELQARRHLFCWLYTPKYEEVMIAPGEMMELELVGASYAKENGTPVQTARFYRVTRTGGRDFLMVTEDGLSNTELSFEEMIERGSELNPIQDDL